MKKLLIGLTLLFSFSSFANEICVVDATEAYLTQIVGSDLAKADSTYRKLPISCNNGWIPISSIEKSKTIVNNQPSLDVYSGGVGPANIIFKMEENSFFIRAFSEIDNGSIFIGTLVFERH